MATEKEADVSIPQKSINLKNKILGGIIGLCVADALGVPVEFTNRESLKGNPVTDMRGYGTYNQPPGTWSDDTSMTLCLLDSLKNGLDYADIMRKFLLWIKKAEYSPHGKVFDVGITTRSALARFASGTEPLECGGISERDNGNGSLMRILPLAFYLCSSYGNNFADNDEAFRIIHDVSSLTHAHKRSHIACGIYLSVAVSLFDAADLKSEAYSGIRDAKKWYGCKDEYIDELKHYNRIFDDDFMDLPKEAIKSGGYVVDTLESALWCLLNTDSYESCVLKAVNLGGDTDTVAAVAGGLAGICYGYEAIPQKWLGQIARLEYIKELCGKLYEHYFTMEFPDDAVIMAIEPSRDFTPSDIRKRLENNNTELELATVHAEVNNKTGWLMHELDELEEPELSKSKAIFDEWWGLYKELVGRITDILKKENDSRIANHKITDRGLYYVVKPLMERNGFRDGAGWWVK